MTKKIFYLVMLAFLAFVIACDSSDSDFQTIANIKANFKEVKDAIKKDEEVNIDVLDEIENFAINEMISKYGDDIIKALK